MKTVLGSCASLCTLLAIAGCGTQSEITPPDKLDNPGSAQQTTAAAASADSGASASDLGPATVDPESTVDYKQERKIKACAGLIYDAGRVSIDHGPAKLIVPEPNEAAAAKFLELGMAQLERNENLEAIASCTRAIIHSPRNAESYLQLGHGLLRVNGWQARAKAAYLTGIECAPDSAALRFAHADSLWRLNAQSEAIGEYRKAVELDPQLGAVWVRLANAHYLLRDFEAAWEAVQAAEKLGAQVPQQMRSKLVEKL